MRLIWIILISILILPSIAAQSIQLYDLDFQILEDGVLVKNEIQFSNSTNEFDLGLPLDARLRSLTVNDTDLEEEPIFTIKDNKKILKIKQDKITNIKVKYKTFEFLDKGSFVSEINIPFDAKEVKVRLTLPEGTVLKSLEQSKGVSTPSIFPTPSSLETDGIHIIINWIFKDVNENKSIALFATFTKGTSFLPSIIIAAIFVVLLIIFLIFYHRFRRVREISIRDKLTGLYNLHHFGDILKKQIEKHKQISLLILDLDDFKKFNDKYGHLAGDELLKKFAEILLKNTREKDIIGRYGGEEFMVLLIDTDYRKAKEIAERIRKAVEDYRFKSRKKITVSIGLATTSKKLYEKELIHEADKALYKSKRAGKNKVTGIDLR